MKSAQKLVGWVLMVAVVCGIAAILIARREAAQLAVLRQNTREAELEPARNQPAPVEAPVLQVLEAPPPAEEAAPTPPEQPAPVIVPAKKAAGTVAVANPAPRGTKPPLKDPLARDALFFVGADADAEQYWALAINDPSLPGHERQDLIEDLNEEGFPDPRNLTADDVPLILSRIALIEQHAGDAMDEVNAAAFMEAYKDLWNMLARATQW